MLGVKRKQRGANIHLLSANEFVINITILLLSANDGFIEVNYKNLYPLVFIIKINCCIITYYSMVLSVFCLCINNQPQKNNIK